MLRSVSSLLARPARFFSDKVAEGERRIQQVLKTQFPKAETIVVQDVSGGCGSMYTVAVETVEFKGMTKVEQHKLVTKTLSEEIKNMHGLTIHTKALKQ